MSSVAKYLEWAIKKSKGFIFSGASTGEKKSSFWMFRDIKHSQEELK